MEYTRPLRFKTPDELQIGNQIWVKH